MAVKGTTVNINDQDYVFAPLTLGTLETMDDDIAGIDNLPFSKQAAIVINLALASLKRNYPEMKRNDVAELVDVSNMWEIFTAIAQVSNLVQNTADGQGNTAKK